MRDATWTQEEVQAPPSCYCHSGHIPPEIWESDPPNPPNKTRFFKVTYVEDSSLNGIYCDLCLTVAHWAAHQQKFGNRI